MVNEEKSKTEQVRQRLLGLTDEEDIRNTSKQLVEEGFNAGTVRNVISDMRRKGELPPKNGDTASTSLQVSYPSKVAKGDLIPPEVALRGIQLEDGIYRKGFTDGMSVLILAARYNQVLAASQAEILTNQLKIMEESRKGSAEVAQEAAARAAAGVGAQIMPEVDALKTLVASQGGANPAAALMMTLMEPAFRQAAQQLGRLFGGTQPGGAAQPGGAGQSETGEQPGGWKPPNVEVHRRDELEE